MTLSSVPSHYLNFPDEGQVLDRNVGHKKLKLQREK